MAMEAITVKHTDVKSVVIVNIIKVINMKINNYV